MMDARWQQAKSKLHQLVPDDTERGRVLGKLLELPVDRRLEYFDEEDGAVVAALSTLAGTGAGTGQSAGILARGWHWLMGQSTSGIQAGSSYATPAGAAVQSTTTDIKGQLDRIEQHLTVKKDFKFSFSGSKTGKSEAVTSALSAFQLVGLSPVETLPRFHPAVRSQQYQVFQQWGQPADEDRSAPDLLRHFQEQFAAFALPLGVSGSYDLRDVRGQHLLGFTLDTGTGLLLFSGGADAVLVPHGEVWWPKQLRMVVDWKTPSALRDMSYMQGTPQAVLEMLGALANSNHPALVVFTDGSDFVILQPYGSGLRYLHTLPHNSTLSAGQCNRDDAFRFLIHHVQSIASPDPQFSAYGHNMHINAELEQELQPLKKAKTVFSDGEGLAEQLESLKALGDDERLEAMSQSILAWRGMFS